MIWFILPLSPHDSELQYVFMCAVIFESHRDPDSQITKEWHPFSLLFSPLITGSFSPSLFFSLSPIHRSACCLCPRFPSIFSATQSQCKRFVFPLFRWSSSIPKSMSSLFFQMLGICFSCISLLAIWWSQKGVLDVEGMQKRKTQRESHLLWRARNIIEVQFANRALRKLLVLSLLLLFSCLGCLRECCDTHFKLWIVAYHATMEDIALT